MDIARRFIIITTSTINTSYFSENCLYTNCFIHNTIPGTVFIYSFDFITFEFCRKLANQMYIQLYLLLTKKMTTTRTEGEREREREKITTTRRRGYVEPSDITIYTKKRIYFSNEIKHIEKKSIFESIAFFSLIE